MGPSMFDDMQQGGTPGLYGSGADMTLPAPQTDQALSLAPPSLAGLYPPSRASTPPFVAPQQTPHQQPKTRLQLALAAMIPVALAKGGPGPPRR